MLRLESGIWAHPHNHWLLVGTDPVCADALATLLELGTASNCKISELGDVQEPATPPPCTSHTLLPRNSASCTRCCDQSRSSDKQTTTDSA